MKRGINIINKKIDLTKFKNNNKGFTIIELIVVMAILAILVLLAAPKYLNYVKNAEVVAMKADIRLIEDIVKRGQIEYPDKGYPIKDEEAELSDEAKDFIVGDYVDAVGGEDYPKTEDGEPDKDAIIDLSGVKPVDPSKIKDETKNTKDNPDDYVIATNGPLEGKVYHEDGYEDSDGDYHNGLDSLVTRKKDKTVKDSRYVMATDDDFEFVEETSAPDGVGYFRYIGDGDYIEIPHIIQSKSIESYYKMFASGASNTVKGVKSTNKNIKYLKSMFNGSELAKMDLIYFNASKVESASQMFFNAVVDGKINMRGFTAPNITSTSAMFFNVQADSIDFSNAKITHGLDPSVFNYKGSFGIEGIDTSSMFNGAIINGEINMSNFDAPNIVSTSAMFLSVQADSIDFSNAKITHGLDPSLFDYTDSLNLRGTGTRSMFQSAIINGEINMSNFYAPNIVDTSVMFQMTQADSIDFSNAEITTGLDPEMFLITERGKIIGPDMSKMFFNANIENNINMSNFNAPNIVDMGGVLQGAKAGSFDMSESSVTTGLTGLFQDEYPVIKEGISMHLMFQGAVISDINMSNIEAPNLMDLSAAFQNAEVVELNLSNFDTSGVSDVYNMFQNYTSEKLDLSNFDLSKIVKIDGMLYGTHLNTVYVQSQAQADRLFINTNKPAGLQIIVK